MERQRYLIKFYYIGSGKYFGSQRQLEFETIEDRIIASLLEKEYIKDLKSAGFEVASRTDRFVSARGACFSFISEKFPILMEINSALPRDIGLWAYCKVHHDFLSRFNAQYRHYKYIFPLPIGHEESKVYDFRLMAKACEIFEGRHDFLNFSKREKEDINTIRDILLATLKVEDQFIIFDFKSKAFLRQQIRRMVAKLLEVGKRESNLESFTSLFSSDGYTSYQPADPTCLILWDIMYDENVQFIIDLKSRERMNQFFSDEFYKFNIKQMLFKILQHDNIS